MPVQPAIPFQRTALLQQLQQQWDVVVIGGGATGLGIAVDAATRGFRTALFEQSDFAKGTSSRSTKLVHGGVRYLAQGNIPLVYDALQERGRLLQNAPHLVRKQAFIIPCYSHWEEWQYLTGLKLYDALAGKLGFGKSQLLSKAAVLEQLPTVNAEHLRGGVLYYDGQFDDARLAVNLAQTAVEAGAVVLNYMKVMGFQKMDSRITGVTVRDEETGKEYAIASKVVINATGVFADALQQLDEPGARPLLKQSQGTHIVLPKKYFTTAQALMIPKTRDGRVLFAIPWHGAVVVGTTDTPVPRSALEPHALESEIDFILDTLNSVLNKPVSRNEIISVFAGLRPLVLPQKEIVSTKDLSRDHKIIVNASGLITIIGGKWTTYRKMAEDTVNTAIKTGRLPHAQCYTRKLAIHGSSTEIRKDHLGVYGTDTMEILKSWELQHESKARLHPAYSYTEAEVLWAARHEQARTVEDVLARRLRLLFIDAAAAVQAAPRVAQLLQIELQYDDAWTRKQIADFTSLASLYKPAAQHISQPQTH